MIRVGIDFGTTTTLVATGREDGAVQLSPLRPTGQLTMPSDIAIVTAGAEQLILYGHAARSHIRSSSERVHGIRSLKRHLACQETCAQPPTVAGQRCSGHGAFEIAGEEHTLGALIAGVIRSALDAAGLLPIPPDAALVMGCPTDAGLHERLTLIEAARLAGLELLLDERPFNNLREEPLLAAKTLPTFTELTRGRYLVVDVGGGSTDIAVVDYRPDEPISVIASTGDRFCGGDDIDAALRGIAVERLASRLGLSVEEAVAAATEYDVYALGRDVESAKLELNRIENTEMRVLGTWVPLTITDLQTAVEDSRVFWRIGRLIDEALRSAICAAGLRRYPGMIPTPGQDWAGKTPDGIMVESLRKMDRAALLEEIDFVMFAGGVPSMALFREWFYKEFVGRRRDGSPMIVGEVGLPTVQRVAYGGASGIKTEMQSMHRFPYQICVAGEDGSEPVVEAYARTRGLRGTKMLAPDDRTLEIESMEEDWRHSLEIPWNRGRLCIELDEIGRLEVFNPDVPSGRLRPPEQPWRTEPQLRLERLLQAEIDAANERERQRLKENTDPRRAMREDVG